MTFYQLCLILIVGTASAQRYMPYSDPYLKVLQPNLMPQFKQFASTYQYYYPNSRPEISNDGVKVENSNGVGSFWLLCQSANCGRG